MPVRTPTAADIDWTIAPDRISVPDAEIWLDQETQVLSWKGNSRELERQHAQVLHHILYCNLHGVRPTAGRLAVLCSTTRNNIHKVISELRPVLAEAGASIPHAKVGYRVVATTKDREDESVHALEEARLDGSSLSHMTEPLLEPAGTEAEELPGMEQHLVGRQVTFSHRVASLSVFAVAWPAIPPIFIDPRLRSHYLGPRTYPEAPYVLALLLPLLYWVSYNCMNRLPPVTRALAVLAASSAAIAALLPFYGPEIPHAHVLLTFCHLGLYLAIGIVLNDYNPISAPSGIKSTDGSHERVTWQIILVLAFLLITVIAVFCVAALPKYYDRIVTAQQEFEMLQRYSLLQVTVLVAYYLFGAPLPQAFRRAMRS